MKISENFQFLYGMYSAGVGIIISEDEVALVDSAWVAESVDHLYEHLEELMAGRTLKYVFVTHTDPDHIGGLQRLKRDYNPEIVIHRLEAELIQKPPYPLSPAQPDIIVDGNAEFNVGNLRLQLLYTPGHSEGSFCIFNEEQGVLFAGDTVFPGPPENFYLPYTGRMYKIPVVKSSIRDILDSLNRLSKLDAKWILPGHGMPIRGKERIAETIRDILGFKDKAYELFKDELSVSELAEKLEAYPVTGFGLAQTHPVSIGVSHYLLFAERIIDELLSENKIEARGQKTITHEHLGQKCTRQEPCYKRI